MIEYKQILMFAYLGLVRVQVSITEALESATNMVHIL